jgi:hypothetical protein
VNSENEFWSKNMAVGLVDAAGKDRTSEPANVRSYLVSSLPHSGAIGPNGRGICQQPRNPLVANGVLRALLVAMDQWVSAGVEPPASRVPRVADGTLVAPLPRESVGFPAIRGVTYNGRMHTGDLFDYGPKFAEGILTTLPPRLVGTPYPALVPKTDADGNDLAGIRIPEVAVPLATYTGWALRAVPAGGDDGCDAAGQQIAFAKTKAERIALGDPRPSLEERYPSHAEYVNAWLPRRMPRTRPPAAGRGRGGVREKARRPGREIPPLPVPRSPTQSRRNPGLLARHGEQGSMSKHIDRTQLKRLAANLGLLAYRSFCLSIAGDSLAFDRQGTGTRSRAAGGGKAVSHPISGATWPGFARHRRTGSTPA